MDQNQTPRVSTRLEFNQPGQDSSGTETIHEGCPVMPSLMPSFSKYPPVQGRKLDMAPEAQRPKCQQATGTQEVRSGLPPEYVQR